MKLAELAAAVGMKNYGLVSTNVGRWDRELADNTAEGHTLKQVLKMIKCEI